MFFNNLRFDNFCSFFLFGFLSSNERKIRLCPSANTAFQTIYIFDAGLADCANLTALSPGDGGSCNYYKYIAVTRERLDRKAVKTLLREKWGVSLAGEVYEDPIQRQPIFTPYATAPLPVSEDVCARHICLPVFPSMTDEQANRVVEALKATIG